MPLPRPSGLSLRAAVSASSSPAQTGRAAAPDTLLRGATDTIVSLTVRQTLASLITRMDDKASVWVAVVVNGRLDNAKLPGGQQKLQGQLANLETVTAVVRVGTDVNVDVTLGMKDEASAQEMGTAVDEVI